MLLAFETDAPYMTYNFNDGRCILMDSTATLTGSGELSTAFTNECSSGFLITSLDEFEDDSQTTIFPNPTHSSIILNTKNTFFTEGDNVQIFSIIGERIFVSKIDSRETTIELANYPSGVYVLVSKINGISSTFKILKE